jgi:RNA polymerase sigma-70 factor (ECF subfamily)
VLAYTIAAEIGEVSSFPSPTKLPFHATRADLLQRVGRNSEATRAYERAAAMAPPDAERDFLRLGGRASG